MSETLTDAPWPLLVSIGSKKIAALMNRKAYTKSLENASPWLVHPQTARILPWPGSPQIVALTEEPGSYNLVLPEGSILQPYGPELPTDINPDQRNMASTGKNDLNRSEVFTQLAQLIAERHKLMPAGSYTTHLFAKGQDKIRKKLGEEAIELVLAQEKADVIYESADLLYHMQVLLEELNINWAEVEEELLARLQE